MPVPPKSSLPMSLLSSALPRAAGSISAQNSAPPPQNNPQLWPGPRGVNTSLSSIPGGCSPLSPSSASQTDPPPPASALGVPRVLLPAEAQEGSSSPALLRSLDAQSAPPWAQRAVSHPWGPRGGVPRLRALWRPNPQKLHPQRPPVSTSSGPTAIPTGPKRALPTALAGTGETEPAPCPLRPEALPSNFSNRLRSPGLGSLLPAPRSAAQPHPFPGPRRPGSLRPGLRGPGAQPPPCPGTGRPGPEPSPALRTPFCLKCSQSPHPGHPQLQAPWLPNSSCIQA